ncbi:MAG: hypothetical protein A3G27_11510 [Betaproteobacteria bacterium RIFCSPLOWO2_12_FULL_66_14]|nr:MAG: hypothetical protein A3G27_11510 [Betaproteobacteria bacterium RIFCSPLOWO2_12_FULL_66_14]
MNAFTFLVMLGALATVVALFNGVLSMAQGGEYDQRHSHELMFRRVAFQALTVLLMFLAMWGQSL